MKVALINNNIQFQNSKSPQQKNSENTDKNSCNYLIDDSYNPDCKLTSDHYKHLLGIKDSNNIAKFDIIKKPEERRIEATFLNGEHKGSTIELPQYLYHVTSACAMDDINKSGYITKSGHEFIKGVFLLDSENFLDKYRHFSLNNKKTDLVSSIFRWANRTNIEKGIKKEEQKIVIIKIPTADLLKGGELKIRTQEDFFGIQDKIKAIQREFKLPFCNLEELTKESDLNFLMYCLVAGKIINENEAEKIKNDVNSKLKKGYTLKEAADLELEKTHAIEYVFKDNIKLSDYPNIETVVIKVDDYSWERNGRDYYPPRCTKEIFDKFFL